MLPLCRICWPMHFTAFPRLPLAGKKRSGIVKQEHWRTFNLRGSFYYRDQCQLRPRRIVRPESKKLCIKRWDDWRVRGSQWQGEPCPVLLNFTPANTLEEMITKAKKWDWSLPGANADILSLNIFFCSVIRGIAAYRITHDIGPGKTIP